VGVNAIAMRDHFGGCEFWWGDRGGGVYGLVSPTSAALNVHYSVYVLEPNKEAASRRYQNVETESDAEDQGL
jgi:hypothetical protein